MVRECSYDGGVNRDRVVNDSGRTWQFGRFEASSCGCYGDGDNAGDRRGEMRKRRDAEEERYGSAEKKLSWNLQFRKVPLMLIWSR
jgi:hypothetical protein